MKKKYTPATAKKLYSLQSANYQYREVNKNELENVGNSRRAIRSFCTECSDSQSESTKCKVEWCAFWVYRKGTRPSQKDINIFTKALAIDEKTHSPNQLKYQNMDYYMTKQKGGFNK